MPAPREYDNNYDKCYYNTCPAATYNRYRGKCSLRAPMALAVIGGLVSSTLLTLIVIPCVYWIFRLIW